MNKALTALALTCTLLCTACPPVGNSLESGTTQSRPANGPSKILRYEDAVYEPHIRSVQFYKNADPLSYPFLYLNEAAQLTLEFDALIPIDAQPDDLWITVINCDADWEPSHLIPIEFYDGFTQDRISNWDRSRNTKVPYVHYKYRFPGDNMRFKRSGNYLLKVYRDGNEEDIVLTRRLTVAENRVGIQPQMDNAYSIGRSSRIQRLDFDVLPGTVQTFDPRTDLRVVILQNGRWDNAYYDLRPTFATADNLQFQFNAGEAFTGSNEYRLLDMRSFRFYTDAMSKVESTDSITYVYLQPDAPRDQGAYLRLNDFNGNYWVEVQEWNQDEVEADYALVKFSLKQPQPFTDGNVYVMGAFNGWRQDEENKLVYNASKFRYETDILLKQGVYNYEYVFVPLSGGYPDDSPFEGNYYQAENFYTILVYYRPPGGRTDDLVGFAHVNYRDR